MKVKKIIYIIFFILSFSKIADSQNNIFFNFDYSIFKNENGTSILEIYFSVDQKSLKYVIAQNTYEADAKMDISISDISNNKIMFSNVYKTPSVVSDTSSDKLNQKLIGQVNYILPDGNYKLRIRGSDFNDSSKTDVFEQDLAIDNSETNKIKVSDIELSSSVSKSNNDKSIFYKNTLEIIPNPSGLFGMNLKDLYYYFEMYGLTANNISDGFILNYTVSNLNNEKLIYYEKKVKRAGISKADFGKIKIDSLNRGSYSFKVELLDSMRNVKAQNEKKFYIYNNTETVTNQGNNENEYLKSEYSSLPEKNIQDEFEKTAYIMKEEETNKFKSLKSLDDKRKFLFNFWTTKKNSSNDRILDSRIVYLKRVNEANKLYPENFKEGWRSDRGRIYIVYGKPDDIERHPFESNLKSYEIWKYNSVEGGGECVFIELQPSTGSYWLVHSTFRDELKNDNWTEQLNSGK